jgi:hypothetical protein
MYATSNMTQPSGIIANLQLSASHGNLQSRPLRPGTVHSLSIDTRTVVSSFWNAAAMALDRLSSGASKQWAAEHSLSSCSNACSEGARKEGHVGGGPSGHEACSALSAMLLIKGEAADGRLRLLLDPLLIRVAIRGAQRRRSATLHRHRSQSRRHRSQSRRHRSQSRRHRSQSRRRSQS